MARALDAPGRAMLRFLLIGIGLTILAGALQNEIVARLLPLFRAWLDLVDTTFRTLDLSIVSDHSESMVRRLSTPAFVHAVGNTFLYPGPVLFNQAAAGIVLQPAILAIALLAVWPLHSRKDLCLRLLLGAVFLPLLLVLDVPMMLCGFAWYTELKEFDPSHFSLLVSWADAMNAGGRFALAIVAAASATALAVRLSVRLEGMRDRTPLPT